MFGWYGASAGKLMLFKHPGQSRGATSVCVCGIISMTPIDLGTSVGTGGYSSMLQCLACAASVAMQGRVSTWTGDCRVLAARLSPHTGAQ